MVQIIPNNEKRSFAEQVLSGLNEAMPQFQRFLADQEQSSHLSSENEALKRMGLDVSGVYDPEIRKQITGLKLQGRNAKEVAEIKNRLQGEKNNQNLVEDEKRYDVIKNTFGEKAAELYKAAPEGGKTAIINSLLDASQRGLDLDQLLGGQASTRETSEKSREKSNIKAIDYDRGLTPKERVRRQEDRYSKNLPLYQESTKKLQSLDAEKEGLNILQELSPQISGMARLNINPQTGELIIPAAASPEVQRYVKTLNDFTTRAKDSYGSRVTNFDLQQYMRRLPSLANSEEGRNQIIRQMKIINDINTIREQSLQDIIDEHGGIRNIDFDNAERLADKHSKSQIETLKKEFKSIDNTLEKEYKKQIEEEKAIVPKGRVSVERADGTRGYIPTEKLKDFLKIPGNKKL